MIYSLIRKKKFIIAIFFVSLLYVSVFLPLLYSTHFSGWYKFTCKFHEGCENAGLVETSESFDQLQEFFFFKNKLDERWDSTQKKQFRDLRNYFATGYRLLIISFLCLMIFVKRKRLNKSSALIVISGSVVLLVPQIFNYLQYKIFKPVFLGENNLLENTNIFSQVIPDTYFEVTLKFILIFLIILNLAIFLLTGKSRRRRKRI